MAIRQKAKTYLGKYFEDVYQDAIPEKPRSPLLTSAPAAASTIQQLASSSENKPLRARGRELIRFTPDYNVVERTGEEPSRSLARHALTNEDRTTIAPDKVRSAGLIRQTLSQADFVLRDSGEAGQDYGGPRNKVFAKLYGDENGHRLWHFVIAAPNGDFVTQFSTYEQDISSRIKNARVKDAGDRPPKEEAPENAQFSEAKTFQSPTPSELRLVRPTTGDVQQWGSQAVPTPETILNQVENEQAELDRLKAAGADSRVLQAQQLRIAALEKEFDRLMT